MILSKDEALLGQVAYTGDSPAAKALKALNFIELENNIYMNLRICSFASGSSGNSYLIQSESTGIILDAGISGKKIMEGLSSQGADPENIRGIFVTHEHVDHIKSIRVLSKKIPSAEVFASGGTLGAIGDKVEDSRKIEVSDGEELTVGDISVKPFSICHDAACPLGYSFSRNGRTVSVVTDTGCVTDGMMDTIRESDILVLEANHEVNLLMLGSYPYNIKRRILSDEGHLSNEASGECLCRMLKERTKPGVPEVALAHISKEHNTPDQALMTIKNILFESDLFDGKDVNLSVLPRDEVRVIGEV